MLIPLLSLFVVIACSVILIAGCGKASEADGRFRSGKYYQRCRKCLRWFNKSGEISYFEIDGCDRTNPGVCPECLEQNKL